VSSGKRRPSLRAELAKYRRMAEAYKDAVIKLGKRHAAEVEALRDQIRVLDAELAARDRGES
jgi:hypothetical protein